jgi:hypothetical protein
MTELLKHRDTKAGWLGPDRKAKLRAQGIEFTSGFIARVEFENAIEDAQSEKQKAELKTQLEALIADEGLMEVKKYNGPTTKFRPARVLNVDPWGINLEGERVSE